VTIIRYDRVKIAPAITHPAERFFQFGLLRFGQGLPVGYVERYAGTMVGVFKSLFHLDLLFLLAHSVVDFSDGCFVFLGLGLAPDLCFGHLVFVTHIFDHFGDVGGHRSDKFLTVDKKLYSFWADACAGADLFAVDAHAADFNDYTDLGAIGFLGDLVYTWGILNNAATVATNTTTVPTDGVSETFEIRVGIDGAVTAFYNGVSKVIYSAGTTQLVFDAGDILIPTVRAVNISGGDPDVIISELLALPSSDWKS